MIASCSSGDFRAKLREDAMRIPLRPPFFSEIIPSRTVVMGRKSCAALAERAFSDCDNCWGGKLRIYKTQTTNSKILSYPFFVICLLCFVILSASFFFYIQTPRKIGEFAFGQFRNRKD